MKRFLASILAIFCFASYADSPPDWRTFEVPLEVKSQNSEFAAKIEVADKQGRAYPLQWKWRLTVYRISSSARSLWKADYAFDGSRNGLLSNDGQYFVHTSFWYSHDEPVVSIYHPGSVHHFSGKDLGISVDGLPRTVSHTRWLKDGYQYRFVPASGAPTAIEIDTVQGLRRIRLKPNPSIEPTR